MANPAIIVDISLEKKSSLSDIFGRVTVLISGIYQYNKAVMVKGVSVNYVVNQTIYKLYTMFLLH